MNQAETETRKQSLWSVARSVMASFMGVQSSEKHAEDFKHGKASSYILVGIIATVLFILGVFGIVKLVMSVAQP